MCKCKNIDFGDYSNMTIIIHNNKRIQVDKCIANEIEYLLNQGVETLSSCCGHNKVNGYIAVAQESIPLMYQLGYKNRYNKHYPNSKQYFIPKSIRR